MDVNKKNTERRASLIILTVSIIVITIIVIIGICVLFLVDESVSKVILFALLGILIFVGIMAFLFMELQRLKALRKRDRSAELWLQQTLDEQRQRTRPTAPPMSARTSWALTAPWRHSERTTLPAYSPPHTLQYDNQTRNC